MRQTWFGRKLTAIGVSKLASIAAICAVVGCIGVTLVVLGHATTPTAAAEAENGVLSGNSKVVADTTASGSQAVRFGGSTTNMAVSNTCAAGYPHPSGMLMPTGDLVSNGSTWDQVYADDFTTDPFSRPLWEDGVVTTGTNPGADGSGNSATNYMTDPTKKAALLNNQYNIWSRLNGQDGAYASSSWATSNTTDINNECIKVASTYNASTSSFVTGGLATSYLHNIKYGRWETAYRIDTSTYVVYAHMLYGRDAAWPKFVENDLAEGNGTTNDTFFTTNHYDDSTGAATKVTVAKGVMPADGSTFSSWHREAVEWKPGEMDYYLDGTKFATIKSIAYAQAGTAADSSCTSAAVIARGYCYVDANAIPDNLSGADGQDLGLRRLVFQTETPHATVTATTPAPNAYIDWVAIWQLQQ